MMLFDSRRCVGVGISGKEGLQAVNASDFSIAQFRFLSRLLLVHGRWNYRRMSMVLLYSFYKNITIAMGTFVYSIFTGWSGCVAFAFAFALALTLALALALATGGALCLPPARSLASRRVPPSPYPCQCTHPRIRYHAPPPPPPPSDVRPPATSRTSRTSRSQTPFDSWLYSSTNWFLLLPIIILGLLERDLSDGSVLADPRVYETGRKNMDIGMFKMFLWIINAIISVFIGFLLPWLAMTGRDFGALGGGSPGVSDHAGCVARRGPPRERVVYYAPWRLRVPRPFPRHVCH